VRSVEDYPDDVTVPSFGPPVVCSKYGFGLQNNIADIVSKCKRNRRGMDVVGCPGLKPELLRAAAALRGNEHR
jgi:hypothetical protein